MADFSYDLAGAEPIVKDLVFNNAVATDGNVATADGAFVKVADWDQASGRFVTLATGATAWENTIGICMEDVAATTETYLINTISSTGTWQRKKILVNPHAVYMVEYSQAAADLDTAFVIPVGTASTTSPNTGDADIENGGWLYFTNGSNADYLHNILESADSAATGIEALRTTTVNAVASGDDIVVIEPPFSYAFDVNTACTMLQSELIVGSRAARFCGIDYWMSAPGFPLQKLHPSTHDALKIADARFFHELSIHNHYFNNAFVT